MGSGLGLGSGLVRGRVRVSGALSIKRLKGIAIKQLYRIRRASDWRLVLGLGLLRVRVRSNRDRL